MFKSSPPVLLTNHRATFNAPVDAAGKPTEFKAGGCIKIEIDGPSNDGYARVVSIADEDGFLSTTFVTLEGHLDRGVANFALSDRGNGTHSFTITTVSEVDMSGAKVFENFTRYQQAASWDDALDNFVRKSGGVVEDREIVIVPAETKKEGEWRRSTRLPPTT